MRTWLRFVSSRFVIASVCSLVSILLAVPALAATIKIEFDDNAGGKHDGARGRGSVGDANFGENAPFSSRGFDADPTKPGSQKGSLLRNASDKVLKDLHLKLTSPGDTFD